MTTLAHSHTHTLTQRCPHKGGPTYGYGGLWQWDENLFPAERAAHPPGVADNLGSHPGGIMSWLASLNLSSYLDIHQCPGVLKENVNYESFARAMGVSPRDIKEGVTVPIEV